MGLKLMGSLSIMFVVSYGFRGVSSTWWNSRGPKPNVPVPEPLSESKAPHLFSPFLASMTPGSAAGTAGSVDPFAASVVAATAPVVVVVAVVLGGAVVLVGLRPPARWYRLSLSCGGSLPPCRAD